MLNGCDISAYQAYTPDLTPYQFIVVRASIGLLPDVRYDQHMLRALAEEKKREFIPMAYHFGTNADVNGQADIFLKSAHGADYLWLDLEGNGATTMADSQAAQFIKLVHARGKRIGLYHSRCGYHQIGQDANWVADYDGDPNRAGISEREPWTFWQYRGSPLDLDHFNGDMRALRALVGTASPYAAAIAQLQKYIKNLSTHPEKTRELQTYIDRLREYKSR